MNRIAFHIVAAAAVGIASTLSAHAADMGRPAPVYRAPPVAPPVYNWSGFYVGGNVGWAFGDASVTYNPTGATWDIGKDGFMGGLQAGVNWQTGAFVFGIEGEFDWINGKGTRNLLAGPGVAGLWGDGGTTWMATIAGRAGFAVDNVLWYAKGGAGWVENTATIYNANGSTLWTGSNTPLGWLIGAGVEVGLAPNWTAKLEYQYLNLENWTGVPNITGLQQDSVSVSRDIQTLKAGFNYKF
jgi:opacity protein-like surface antigen